MSDLVHRATARSRPTAPAEAAPTAEAADRGDDIEEVVRVHRRARAPIFEVCRLPEGKRFLQRLPGSEEWGGVAEIEEKPLYHLPQLLT